MVVVVVPGAGNRTYNVEVGSSRLSWGIRLLLLLIATVHTKGCLGFCYLSESCLLGILKPKNLRCHGTLFEMLGPI